jgi:AraC family transcriptional regulator
MTKSRAPDLYPPCQFDGDGAAHSVHPMVEISPSEVVRRRAVTGHGMAAESVQSNGLSKIQYRFQAPMHLLIMHEKGGRRGGETFVEGLPRSTLRNLERKLTFVPADHEYHEWREPHGQTRLMHFYFDPAKLKIHSELGVAGTSVAPRILFEDATIWDTALKLKMLVECPSGDPLYFEALGTLLVYELVRLNRGMPRVQPQIRGGLAPWQQRAAIGYIEEHLNEQISLATLADVVRLSSPYYFCRLFKQSVGMPPHRYQTRRRMEHAKLLLARRAVSVTDISLTVGFGSSNAFATAFRKATGFTPTEYRRSLAFGSETIGYPANHKMLDTRASEGDGRVL